MSKAKGLLDNVIATATGATTKLPVNPADVTEKLPTDKSAAIDRLPVGSLPVDTSAVAGKSPVDTNMVTGKLPGGFGELPLNKLTEVHGLLSQIDAAAGNADQVHQLVEQAHGLLGNISTDAPHV